MNVTFALPARGQGLPPSMPYRKITAALITIQPDQGDPHDPVRLDVVNCSDSNGVASIVAGSELQQTRQGSL
jgi:hypothetical protein